MTSFASLMALSATYTKESQRLVEDALRERQRKEAQLRKQQEERDAEAKAQGRKLLLKLFEDQERERERMEQLVVKQQAEQQALQRREEEQRDALRYGPKKAAKLAGKHSTGSGDSPNWPSSSSGNRETVRKLRVPDDRDDEPSSPALTREEIRERKLQAELRKTYATAKRSTSTGGYSKHGKKLAGGALDIKTSGTTVELAAGQTVKERLTSLPMTLKVLGGRDKDRRSELEMFYDSKKKRSVQVLEGDEARKFDGYFAPTKKERLKRAQAISTSAPTSGGDSPGPRSAKGSSSSGPTSLKESSFSKPPPAPAATSKQPYATSAHARGTSKQVLSAISSTPKATIPKINKTNTTAPRSSNTAHSRPKRPRSWSLSESPPPKRCHMESDISSTIWKMFGKDREQYTSRDVFSDEEDMEADATILEREEAYSARIAKKEEILAVQEEERHGEEKRRRKRERESAAARGQ